MENKSLQDQFQGLFEKKESLQQFLPLIKKIQNFNLFQMNDNADSLYHFSIREPYFPKNTTNFLHFSLFKKGFNRIFHQARL